MDELCIQMLGGFSLKLGDRELQDTDTRSKKAWALLAYLIVHRDQAVSQNRLIDLLWGSEPDSNNPENALRISMHRTRGLLEQLDPENGRSMILRRKGGYQWKPPKFSNPQIRPECRPAPHRSCTARWCCRP